MDIICHTLTGTAVGTVVTSFSKKNIKYKLSIILLGTLGGALPDFDAISLWSKFDTIIGSFIPLNNSGKQIYFGKFWYSHHAALHSFTVAFFIPLVYVFINSILDNKSLNFLYKNYKLKLKSNCLKILSFSFGFTFHLLEDMPTPHSVWGGVRFLFPYKKYFGGFGKIWWWNNYDLFLIIILCIALNLIVLLIPFLKLKKLTTSTIFILCSILFIYQINTRKFDFNYTGHTRNYSTYEKKSKELQRDILGEKLYTILNKFDNSINLNF